MFQEILDLVTRTEVKKDDSISIISNTHPENLLIRVNEIKFIQGNFEIVITIESPEFTFQHNYHVQYTKDNKVILDVYFNNVRNPKEKRGIDAVIRVLVDKHNDYIRSMEKESKEKEEKEMSESTHLQFNYSEFYKNKINKKVGIRNLKIGSLEQGEDSIRVYLFNKIKTILYNIKNLSFSNLDNGEKIIKDEQSSIGYIKKGNSHDGEILYLNVSYQEIEDLEGKKITHHNRFNMAVADLELIGDIEESIRDVIKRII